MWFSSGTERKADSSAKAEVPSIQSVALKMLSVTQSSHRAACSQTTAPSSHPPLDLDASTYRQSAQASTVRHSGHPIMVSLIAGATELSAFILRAGASHSSGETLLSSLYFLFFIPFERNTPYTSYLLVFWNIGPIQLTWLCSHGLYGIGAEYAGFSFAF